MRLFFTLLFIIPFVSFSQSLTGNRIIYHEPADSATVFNHYVVKQVGTTYGITASKHYKYNGTQSVKFELRDTDPEVQSGTRAEITFPTITNLTRWYAFAVYFPAFGYDYDSNDEVINQWHQGGGYTPALCIRTKEDSIYLRIVPTPGGSNIWINLGAIEKNVWHPYVFKIKHSSSSDGRIDIYRNGKLIYYRDGANMYPVTGEVTNPNWKLGVYKSAWNTTTTDTDRRILYFDDIKMGNENASFREMVPMRFF